MFWVFVPPEQVRADTVEIGGDKAHHLARVLRVRPGERGVAVCAGREYHLEVEAVRRDLVSARILKVRPVASEPSIPLTLLQAVLPNPDFDAVVEGTTAAGVSRIVPVNAARSVARPAAGRLGRWRTIAESAAEQSRRGRIPEVEAPSSLVDALANLGESRLIALQPDALTRLRAAVVRGGPHALAVGPEGGWTDAELAALQAAGAVAVTLGPRILRARLAPVIAAAILIDQA